MAGCRNTPGAALAGVVTAMALMVSACTSGSSPSASNPPATDATSDGSASNAYREPVTLASKDGVLEVTLSAHQGSVALNTVASPVSNFLVFGYELIRGTASDGRSTADNLYPAPALRVDPGQRLIIHFANDLKDMTIQDFYNPAFTPKGQTVPLYPPQLMAAPLNLHTHGLHVSPDGNADNVLLDISAGMGNTYDYAVPNEMPNGMYWYHSHRHTLTAQETYRGLAGLLEIGRPDGNLPIVTQKNIPIRNMALQDNYVFDRAGKGRQLNDPNWPQFVSTQQSPQGSQLADGSYVPKLTPVNFSQTSKGAQYFTNWYQGPLSASNHRGQNQFVPSNLQSFTTDPGAATPGTTAGAASSTPVISVPANPSLPDAQRDVQFTINGQFQPALKSKPGQTEIWVLANISDFAYMNLTLTETATGNHPKIAIVGQDGNPYPEVHYPTTYGGTRLAIPPASRYAIAVNMPKTGDLVLEMPAEPTAKPVTGQAVLYTNNGTDNPAAILGTVKVDPAVISYADGFFIFPTQVMARVQPDSGQGATTDFVEGQKLNAYTSFVDTQNVKPDVTRTLTISGGFGNEKASNQDPKAFVYQFDANTFPNVPLLQPRLGSVEEWIIRNLNNDEHPMHIHVNDFQVMQTVDAVRGVTSGVEMWGADNVNVPAPLTDENENALAESSVTLRTKFTDYTGTYVIHCHRLNHEDNGLMAIVNVIPAVSTYAVAVPGSSGKPATVQVYDGNGDRLLKTVTPFADFEGAPTVAMADVNGDQVLDLIVGTGAGIASQVTAYSGAAVSGGAPFEKELTRFSPFAPDFRGGVNVAAADIDGNGLADNIVVGSGPGIDAQVKVYGSQLPATSGTAPVVFSSFTPYENSKAGVTVATGMVDAVSGRPSIVTAPGPGVAARVKTFRFDLYTPNAKREGSGAGSASSNPTQQKAAPDPSTTSDFLAFDENYLDGVSLSAGWVAGVEGGAKSIITGMLNGSGTVKVYSSGSRLDGQPEIYLESPGQHSGPIKFAEIASFAPFSYSGPGANSKFPGVRVATTSTTSGADLLVSGPSPDGTATEVRKYSLGRNGANATTLTPTLVNLVASQAGSSSAALGGE